MCAGWATLQDKTEVIFGYIPVCTCPEVRECAGLLIIVHVGHSMARYVLHCRVRNILLIPSVIDCERKLCSVWIRICGTTTHNLDYPTLGVQNRRYALQLHATRGHPACSYATESRNQPGSLSRGTRLCTSFWVITGIVKNLRK